MSFRDKICDDRKQAKIWRKENLGTYPVSIVTFSAWKDRVTKHDINQLLRACKRTFGYEVKYQDGELFIRDGKQVQFKKTRHHNKGEWPHDTLDEWKMSPNAILFEPFYKEIVLKNTPNGHVWIKDEEASLALAFELAGFRHSLKGTVIDKHRKTLV